MPGCIIPVDRTAWSRGIPGSLFGVGVCDWVGAIARARMDILLLELFWFVNEYLYVSALSSSRAATPPLLFR